MWTLGDKFNLIKILDEGEEANTNIDLEELGLKRACNCTKRELVAEVTRVPNEKGCYVVYCEDAPKDHKSNCRLLEKYEYKIQYINSYEHWLHERDFIKL